MEVITPWLAPLHIYIYIAILNDKNKLTEDLNKQKTELESCKTGLCGAFFILFAMVTGTASPISGTYNIPMNVKPNLP